MKQQKPYYKLRQLIYNKYGEEKFAIGCKIVARWVSFETKTNVSAQKVLAWCNKKNWEDAPFMVYIEFKALSRLFNLNNDFDEILN